MESDMRNFLKCEDGYTAVEYAVMIAFVAVMITVGTSFLNDHVSAEIERIQSAFSVGKTR